MSNDDWFDEFDNYILNKNIVQGKKMYGGPRGGAGQNGLKGEKDDALAPFFSGLKDKPSQLDDDIGSSQLAMTINTKIKELNNESTQNLDSNRSYKGTYLFE